MMDWPMHAFTSKAGGATVAKVEQLLNDADWKTHCEGRSCLFAFLPHILDDLAKGCNAKS